MRKFAEASKFQKTFGQSHLHQRTAHFERNKIAQFLRKLKEAKHKKTNKNPTVWLIMSHQKVHFDPKS